MLQANTLKLNTEFHRVYAKGKSCASPVLVTYALRNKNSCCRKGITTSKKIGSAVERNRCRRVIRAAFASLSEEIEGNWDLVFVARYKTKTVKSTEVENAMREQLVKLGVIVKS